MTQDDIRTLIGQCGFDIMPAIGPLDQRPCGLVQVEKRQDKWRWPYKLDMGVLNYIRMRRARS